MSLSSNAYTVGTATPLLVVTPSNQSQRVTIHNAEHSTSRIAVVGGPNVTVDTGMHIDAESTLQLMLNPKEALYAIAGTEVDLRVIVQTL